MENGIVYIHKYMRLLPFFFIHFFSFFCFFVFFFFLAHTLNINKRTPLKIQNEMDILSNNDLYELSLTKCPSQLRISEPMFMR